MPWSRSTSATPAISASVFCAFSRISTPSSVRSGTMSANSLVCLTCPAITACVTPAAFSRLMHLPELSERDPVQRRRRRPGRQVGEIGKRFFLDGDDGDVVARAARGVEDEKGKTAVAGDQTQPHRLSAHGSWLWPWLR